jgi:hypothetical protein
VLTRDQIGDLLSGLDVALRQQMGAYWRWELEREGATRRRQRQRSRLRSAV